MPEPAQTWGDLPDHEIERQIMLAERVSWAVPDFNLKPTIPIIPMRNIDPITTSAHRPEGDDQYTDAHLLRLAVRKFDGAEFTPDKLRELCPRIERPRICCFISQYIHKGYLVKTGAGPARYKQIKSWDDIVERRPPNYSKTTPSELPNGVLRFSSSTQAPGIAGPAANPAPAPNTPQKEFDPLITDLIASRDQCRRRADLLDQAITLLQSA